MVRFKQRNHTFFCKS